MQAPKRFPPRLKVLAAAITILAINAALVLIFGNRQWKGLETLVTASDLTPLSGLLWLVAEALAGGIFLGVCYLGRKLRRWLAGLWRAWWQSKIEKAYRDGYNARMKEDNPACSNSDATDGAR